MTSRTVDLPLSTKALRNWSAAWRYLRAGPSHFVMYVFGRFRPIRFLFLFIYRLRPARSPGGRAQSLVKLVEDVDVEYAARMISKDGLFAGLRLRAAALDALRQFSTTSTCFGEEDFRLPFRLAEKSLAEQRSGRKIQVGRLDDALQACPELQDLASDETLVAIARGYFGCQPILLGARIWWSFATEADPVQQRSLGQGFHYDLDGYRALAFFFYLTDVAPANGPHICVRGSHIEKPLKSLLSVHKARSDAEIDKWYGKERQVALCGSAGFGFAEDIFCFHKGLHPKGSDRLMLQLRYGIRTYTKTI